MNIYVESNFVLELALLQEQCASCEAIERICAAGGARLVIPAYALVEPYETLVRRHRQRSQLCDDLEAERAQLKRSVSYSQSLSGLESVVEMLSKSVDEEDERLESVRSRLATSSEVIPLDASILKAASRYQVDCNLAPKDAIMVASVLTHLERTRPAESCFLNRDARDFNVPELVGKLKHHRCTLISRFDHGLEHVRSRLRRKDR